MKHYSHHSNYRRGNTIVSLDTIIEEGKSTLVDDVNRVSDAIARREITKDVIEEVNRLRIVIVDGKMHDVVVNECGRSKLLLILQSARWLNEREDKTVIQNPKAAKKKEKKKVKHKSKAVNKQEGEEPKLNDLLRESWLKKFRAMYGLNGRMSMPEKDYNAMLSASIEVDFTQLINSTKNDVHFWRAFDACEMKAKDIKKKERSKKKRDQSWRPHGRYRGKDSQITTKEFFTIRIGRH